MNAPAVAGSPLELLRARLRSGEPYDRSTLPWLNWPAQQAMRIFRLRIDAAEQGGVVVSGARDLLEALGSCGPDVRINEDRFSFDDGRMHTVFAVVMGEREVIGCLALEESSEHWRRRQEEGRRLFEHLNRPKPSG